MRKRRSIMLATGMLVAVLAILVWAASGETALTQQPSSLELPRETSPRSMPHRADTQPPAPPDPSLPDVNATPEAECRAEIQEADRLARDVAEDCALGFAQNGICLAPVPFEHENQPASQAANMRDWLAPCGLDASELRLDCSENPCVALIARNAVLKGGDRCEPLQVLETRLPALDEQFPPEGVWSEWTPVVLDTPTDPVETMRALSRFNARAATLEEPLQGPDSETLDQCGRARRAITGLNSQDPCAALREYWQCPPSEVELPPGTAEAYTTRAERIVDDLLDTCPAFAESNHVFDCSGVPCILVLDLLPGQAPEDVFCGKRFGSTIFNPRRPDTLAVWMYGDIDEPVYERFDEERAARYEIARAQLEAQRTAVADR